MKAVLVSATTLGLLAAVASCSLSFSLTPGSVASGDVFRILASSGYSGTLTDNSTTTAVSGSGNQDIKFSPKSGNTYTLVLTKNANDGTKLTAEIVANQTINGAATSVIVDSDSTTTQNTPVRVTLTD